MKAISETDLSPLTLYRRGKVRDVYSLDSKRLLIVATDRLSAFDVVLPDPIPMKGIVLTSISKFWFDRTGHICPNHCLSTDPDEYPDSCAPYRDILRGRSMMVRRTEPLPVECVVRGYLAGSGWKEYQRARTVCGITLPAGLMDGSRLPEPIFTPSTKAEVGHDENITFEEAAALVGRELAAKLAELSVALYRYACDLAFPRGIIIADTKFEFGMADGELMLIDEALTPDSSRFWPVSSYRPGRPQVSFDKQYVRDYLESVGWDKTPPAPSLPREIVEKTTEKYLEAYSALTGTALRV
ncbi:MAG: phosphoribosylaminoimidazolesuccinocarboxamide synthase [Bacteroidota bacterium]|nr:phosphoribosylaminoimidazolesuccinocarboxamide synthase [Bacteroidota bacterium]